MRAVIKCDADIIDDQLTQWLEQRNWLPNEPQNAQLVEQHRAETLEYVPAQDRTIAEHTHILTLFDETTRAWGTVCRPNKKRLTFRLKHPVSEKLKKACERLVTDILSNSSLQFSETKIEVLEPQGEHRAFAGTVLSPHRWHVVKQERRTEYRVMLASGAIAIGTLLATSPALRPLLLSPFALDWATWVGGILERLGTTAVVTAIVAGLQLYLHWKDVQREPPIRWMLD